MKVSRELWSRLEPMLDEALEMDGAARDAWLASLDATQPDLAPALRRLLAHHDRAERRGELETVPRLAPAPPWSSAHAPGEAIGPFQLLRLLGRGGMGEVWLARQVDGRVEREVALKLPALQGGAPYWRERFRRERDILARLGHPRIARLYDAGVTEAGQPWLAMEHVEGVSLAEYVERHALPVPQRLELFRQVLEAVAHAHRHLVVHRDLKPANILVDASGAVKLLDFGIAKLIDDRTEAGADNLTRAGGRLMTLRYAAPEQVTEGAITTSTDIYSLGVILHEVLTGLSPHRAVREGRPLTEAAVLQEEPAISLAGDLGAIVRKALRHDPSARYASVEALGEDIKAFLERRPVDARAGSWRYRAGRFAARNKLPLGTAVAVLLTLLASLAVVERERRVAVAEKARAERHFASVRKLANTFIFDVHSEIEHLAGALQARKALVGTAAEYLDRLAAEASAEGPLALEIAGAYRRLAEISGDSSTAHLGDPAAARRYAERAAALLESLEAREPRNIEALREQRVLRLLLGRLRLEAGDASGTEDTARAVRVAEAITRLPEATLKDRRNLGSTMAQYGGILAVVKDDHAGADAQLGSAIATLEEVVRESSGDVASRASLAYAYERAGIAAEVTGKPELLRRAIGMMDKAVATTEAVARDAPLQASYGQALVKRYNNAARMKLRAGDLAGARQDAGKALPVIEKLIGSDPRDSGSASMQVASLATASEVEHRAGRHEKAIELARAAIAADSRLPAELRKGLIIRENVVGAKRTLGASACALAPPPKGAGSRALLAEARTLLEESRAFKRELVERGIDAREAAEAIQDIEANLQRCDGAIARLG